MLTLLPPTAPSVATPQWDDPLPAYPGRGAPVAWRLSPRMAARRQRMREVGARLLHQRGPEAVTLMDVARAADVPASAASHGYRRRNDLVFDILHAYADALHEYVGNAEESAPAGRSRSEDRLRRMVVALLRGMREHRHAHGVTLMGHACLPSGERESIRYLHRTLLYRMAPPLESSLPRRARQHAVVAPLLRSLMAMAAASPLWLHPRGAMDLDDYGRLIVAAVLAAGRAMVARPSSSDSTSTP